MMKKLVVYTCVTGGYDTVSRPTCLPPWADWVAVGTDCPLPWADKDKVRTSRYSKLHPHLLFPDYEYSLWIDGNIDVVDEGFWTRIRQLMEGGVPYAGIKHPQRDDVYEEALRILRNGRETARRLRRAVRFLKREGLPSHSGLDETGIILRRHNDPSVVEFDNLWWDMLFKYSDRDQMSWSYCIWKTGLRSEHILPEGTDIRNHQWFKYTRHDPVYRKNFIKDAYRAIVVKAYRLWSGI